MKKKNFFSDLIKKIECHLPMSFGSFLLFCFTIYLFILVGKSIWGNYNSNKDLEKQESVITELNQKVIGLQNEINYDQTNSYKEKEARAKLGYIAPGEHVVSLPYDKEENKTPDKELGEVEIKTPNYTQWWNFYFQ